MCQRGFKLREKLAHSYIGQPLPDSIHLLPSTPQIKGLHTFIRNKDTPRDEFIFYSKRLIRLVIEYTLSLLPFKVSCTSFRGVTAGMMLLVVCLVQGSQVHRLHEALQMVLFHL
jgi:hypothetical protein